MSTGVRFNSPPNWPVDPGWTSSPEWVPDRSWPPGPVGWQFWIDDSSGHGSVEGAEHPSLPSCVREGPARRKIVLFGGVVALTVGAVAVVSWFTASPAVARPDGMLPGTYPTAPEVAWSVVISDVDAVRGGADHGFSDPGLGAAYYAAVGAVVAGDHVVVNAMPGRSDPEGGQRLSLSLADGSVAWTQPANGRDGCARELVGDVLPGKNTENDGETSQLDFIDINTGKVRSTATVPFYLDMLAGDGDKVYTAGYLPDQCLVVAKGSSADPLSDWKVTIPEGACEGARGGDSYQFQIRGSNMDEWTTEVADDTGTARFTTDQRVLSKKLQVRAGQPSVLVTTTGTAPDAATGETRWRASGWQDVWTTALVGDSILSLGGQSDVVEARVLDTGDSRWSTRLPDASEDDIVSLKATDRGIVYVTPTRIGLLRPTGPAASVPGVNP